MLQGQLEHLTIAGRSPAVSKQTHFLSFSFLVFERIHSEIVR